MIILSTILRFFAQLKFRPSCIVSLNGLAIIACTIAISSSAYAQSQTVSPISIQFAADKSYPPMQYVQNGKATGLLIEIIDMVDDNIDNFDIEVNAYTWAQAKQKVRSGEAFGLVGSYFNGHNWPKIFPYSYPIMYETLVSICNKDNTTLADAKWPQDYQGLKIGTVSGFDGWLKSGINYREQGIANFFQFPNAQLALSAVRKNVVDCTLFEKNAYHALLAQWQKTEKTNSDFNMSITNYISRHSIHIAYSQAILNSGEHPYAREFIKAFDKALFELLVSGQLKPLFAKYDIIDPVFDL